MFIPRIIPVLLLKGDGLVKTVKFANPRYIGDPINSVRIFNDLKADELILLDIDATKHKRSISEILVKNIGDEAFMPFAVGGGIRDIKTIENLLKAGAEKVIINTASFEVPSLIESASRIFGGQSIVVSIDAKKNLFGKYYVMVKNGKKSTNLNPVVFAKRMEEKGAGEIIINSISNDGLMMGYDISLTLLIAESVGIPVVACGGAGKLSDLSQCYNIGKAHALAAGSMFIYHGPRKAILINYPSKKEILEEFKHWD